VRGNALVDVRLVDDLGDELFPLALVREVGVGTGELGAGDAVAGAVDEEEGEEGPAAVDEVADDEDLD